MHDDTCLGSRRRRHGVDAALRGATVTGGRITTATDVYRWGLLYERLIGQIRMRRLRSSAVSPPIVEREPRREHGVSSRLEGVANSVAAQRGSLPRASSERSRRAEISHNLKKRPPIGTVGR